MERNRHYVINKYGVRIVKCCASCGHKQADKYKRFCVIEHCPVPSNYVCAHWVMSDSLDAAGKGGGKVKRGDYLRYAINSLFSGGEGISIPEIRNKFRETHGDIYYESGL